tara:strand:+ start:1764 stop:1889 length:126 start_codon:yes stop_codon:yes gene_type:complete
VLGNFGVDVLQCVEEAAYDLLWMKRDEFLTELLHVKSLESV